LNVATSPTRVPSTAIKGTTCGGEPSSSSANLVRKGTTVGKAARNTGSTSSSSIALASAQETAARRADRRADSQRDGAVSGRVLARSSAPTPPRTGCPMPKMPPNGVSDCAIGGGGGGSGTDDGIDDAEAEADATRAQPLTGIALRARDGARNPQAGRSADVASIWLLLRLLRSACNQQARSRSRPLRDAGADAGVEGGGVHLARALSTAASGARH